MTVKLSFQCHIRYYIAYSGVKIYEIKNFVFPFKGIVHPKMKIIYSNDILFNFISNFYVYNISIKIFSRILVIGVKITKNFENHNGDYFSINWYSKVNVF